MAKSFKGFYVGSGIGYDFYKLPDSLLTSRKYIASISPFIKKSSDQWSFKLGFQALLDKNMTLSPAFHFYPDVNFSFSIVPSYVSFLAGLSGKLEKNEPLKIISENPFLAMNGSLFTLPNTSHELIVSAGLKGNTGLGGNYLVSASYSVISNMLFYSNIVFPDTILPHARGNYFLPIADDVDLLNIHAEMSGPINDKLSFTWLVNLYNYNVGLEYAWNKPAWDGELGLKYNLKDKIIAGMALTAQGKRRLVVNGDYASQQAGFNSVLFEMPAHFNLNLSAEYRYTKILSFWVRLNNISYDNFYEWAYYPTQRFLFMLGFTYSL
jgi:hypothetical protein